MNAVSASELHLLALQLLRPIFDADGTCLFDGNVGMWRVAELRHRAGSFTGKFVQYKAGDPYMEETSTSM